MLQTRWRFLVYGFVAYYPHTCLPVTFRCRTKCGFTLCEISPEDGGLGASITQMARVESILVCHFCADVAVALHAWPLMDN